MDDSKILDLLFERSEQAVGELERCYGSTVRRTASNILRDREDVEECVNDTWLGIWNSIPPLRPDPLGGYICRVARNTAVSRLRELTAEKRDGRFDLVLDELAEAIPSDLDVEKAYDAKELTEAINRFLASQSREDRWLFVRRYFFAEPVTELAKALKISRVSASVRLFRLRDRLKSFLQKEGLLV